MAKSELELYADRIELNIHTHCHCARFQVSPPGPRPAPPPRPALPPDPRCCRTLAVSHPRRGRRWRQLALAAR